MDKELFLYTIAVLGALYFSGYLAMAFLIVLDHFTNWTFFINGFEGSNAITIRECLETCKWSWGGVLILLLLAVISIFNHMMKVPKKISVSISNIGWVKKILDHEICDHTKKRDQ